MPCLLPEDPAEIQRIFISHKTADLLNGVVGIFEKLFRLINPDGSEILHRRYAHIAFKTADKPAHTHVLVFCVFFNTDLL